MSRLREYYADSHSVLIVEDGPRNLSEGLAKIIIKIRGMMIRRDQEAFTFNGFKSLFILDPDMAEIDSTQIVHYAQRLSDQALVDRVLRRKITSADAILELFSTHPNITKRLKALKIF